MSRIRSTIGVVIAGLSASCQSSPSEPKLVASDQQLVASKVAMMALAVATGPEGRGFFDNFVPCPRRGVIDYRNTARGRAATFSGCDAGDGVVIDGDTEVRWIAQGGDRHELKALDVAGGLSISLNGRSTTVDQLALMGITFLTPSDPYTRSPDQVMFSSLRVSAFGETMPLDLRASAMNVLHPTLTMDAIPNVANSLDPLTRPDLARIAFHQAMWLGRLLLNETVEVSRGDHVHTSDCGTTTVTVTPNRLARVDADWTLCPMNGGLFTGGKFSAEWSSFPSDASELEMTITGPMSIGGGVPRLTLSKMTWKVTGLAAGLPADATIAGVITTTGGTRAYSFRVKVDD